MKFFGCLIIGLCTTIALPQAAQALNVHVTNTTSEALWLSTISTSSRIVWRGDSMGGTTYTQLHGGGFQKLEVGQTKTISISNNGSAKSFLSAYAYAPDGTKNWWLAKNMSASVSHDALSLYHYNCNTRGCRMVGRMNNQTEDESRNAQPQNQPWMMWAGGSNYLKEEALKPGQNVLGGTFVFFPFSDGERITIRGQDFYTSMTAQPTPRPAPVPPPRPTGVATIINRSASVAKCQYLVRNNPETWTEYNSLSSNASVSYPLKTRFRCRYTLPEGRLTFFTYVDSLVAGTYSLQLGERMSSTFGQIKRAIVTAPQGVSVIYPE